MTRLPESSEPVKVFIKKLVSRIETSEPQFAKVIHDQRKLVDTLRPVFDGESHLLGILAVPTDGHMLMFGDLFLVYIEG